MRGIGTKVGILLGCAALAGCGAAEEKEGQAVIGPAGGQLALADGSFRVEVPAGALQEDVELRLVRVQAEVPHGIGDAVRLEGMTERFALPVRIVFDKGEASEVAIGVASRTEEGPWMAHLDAALDRFEATIAIEAERPATWALVEIFDVFPEEAKVERGGQLALELRICVEDDPALFESVFVAPIVESCSRWSRADRIPAWEVNRVPGGEARHGYGIVEADGSGATYTAPAAMPPSNPVWVGAQIEIPGRPEGGLGAPITIE